MKPFNRHVLLKLIEKEKKEAQSLVVLPTDYKQPESPHQLGVVLDFATDISLPLNPGDTVVFEKRTMQKIEIDGKIHYLVLENYIYGRI
tara:strand:- start:682 stop:948 length:267 start_codon:yes stop_codon:yes gene_type:complete